MVVTVGGLMIPEKMRIGPNLSPRTKGLNSKSCVCVCDDTSCLKVLLACHFLVFK